MVWVGFNNVLIIILNTVYAWVCVRSFEIDNIIYLSISDNNNTVNIVGFTVEININNKNGAVWRRPFGWSCIMLCPVWGMYSRALSVVCL